MIKAGLPTFGSSEFPRLPTRFAGSGLLRQFITDHGGGTAPEFHGIPY